MKHLLGVFVLAALALTLSGCTGGSGGGTTGASTNTGAHVLNITAILPASTTGFGAQIRPGIAFQAAAPKVPYKAFVRSVTQMLSIADLSLSADKRQIKGTATLDPQNEYWLEIYPASFTLTGVALADRRRALFLAVHAPTTTENFQMSGGETVTTGVEINHNSLAYAKVYNEWVGTGTKTSRTWAAFQVALKAESGIPAQLSSLSTAIKEYLGSLGNLGEDLIGSSFSWKTTIQDTATTLATKIP
jgi:hypothetical protein